MEVKDLILANYRFHLLDEDTLVFTGIYRDDNPDGRQIEVFIDNEEQNIVFNKKSGIEIRQKYLAHKANISEEIIGHVKLPFDWASKKNFYIYSVLKNGTNDEKIEVCKISMKSLMKMRDSIQYSVENITFEDGKLTVIGWAVDKTAVDISLYKDNKNIPIKVSRLYRKDVKAAFDELSKGYEAGFKIETSIDNNKGLELCFTTKEKKSIYKLRRKGSKSTATLLDKVLFYFNRYGLKVTFSKILEKIFRADFFKKNTKEAEYQNWRKKYQLRKTEIEEQRNVVFEHAPKFSFVIPLYDTKPKYLKELIDSIRNQTYTNWELCLADGTGENTPLKDMVHSFIEKDARIRYEILSENKGISENTNAAIRMATGDYIVLADHDDILPGNALFECAKAINEDRTVDVIYSDEDKIDMDGKKYFEPHFKSDFNIDLLCSMNYICHLFVVKRDIIDKVGMLRSEFDGAQDHDFILRCCEVAQNIKHIPKILYHWRCHINSTAANPESKMYAFEAGRKAVEEHYKRVGIPATVEHAEFYGMFRTKYYWDEKPLISIIIPNKDHVDDLKKIMDSIDAKSTYRNYEFVVVENNSTEEATFAYYKEIEKRENVQVLYYDGDFNFSRINNFGVEKAKGEYLLLLNNDTEIITPECLEEMLHICMRDEVGIVGAKLCYDDDTIQHAGVVLGFGGIAGHTFIGSSRYDVGYANRIACVQDYTAVTAACMMTKRSVYEAVDGLTESFKVAFNDIDFCMKVRELGKLVVYTPYAELYHYESKSRGMEDTPEKVERFNSEVARFIDKWNKELQAGDPYYNCNLTLDKADFSLRE